MCASSDFASNHVVSISLPNNNVTGTIPTSISALSRLTALNLGGNNLHGSTPSTLTSVPLASLSLAGNTNVTLPVSQLPGFTALLYVLFKTCRHHVFVFIASIVAWPAMRPWCTERVALPFWTVVLQGSRLECLQPRRYVPQRADAFVKADVRVAGQNTNCSAL